MEYPSFNASASEWLEYLKQCDEEEAVLFAKSWESNPEGFRKWQRKQGTSETDIDELCEYCKLLRSRAKQSTAAQLLAWATQAQIVPAEPIGDQEPDEPPGPAPPKFHTGLAPLDQLLDGGGYGMTVVAGQPKCGKSMFALAMAIEAARSGWRVLYLNAELTRSEIANRIMRYCNGRSDTCLCDVLSIHPVEVGLTIPHVVEKMRERVAYSDERLLIAADSINRIVDMTQSTATEYGYWHSLRMWEGWFRRCSLFSEGKLASVVVSELNVGGHIKGRSLEYAADLCITIKPAQEVGENIFTIDVPFARSSAKGAIGNCSLEWKTGRFVPLDGTHSEVPNESRQWWESDDYSDML